MASNSYRFAITPYKDIAPNRHRGRKFVLRVLLPCLVFALLFCWYIGVFGGNVRTVIPNKVYRSAQLTGANLAKTLDADHIRTVINLRGGSTDDEWYRSETQECNTRGIQHFDIPMSAQALPPPSRLRELLAAFDKAPYPVLFHCRGGSDRSGLAGVLYLNIYQNVPLDEALNRQLTWRYGHFSFGAAHAMNDFFTLYQKTGAGMPLRQWITTRYPALYAKETGENPDVPASPASTASPSRRKPNGTPRSGSGKPASLPARRGTKSLE